MSRPLLLCAALLWTGCLLSPNLEPATCPETAEEMEAYCVDNGLCGASFNSVDRCTYTCDTPCVSEFVALVRVDKQVNAINKLDDRVMGSLSMPVDGELAFGVAGISPTGGGIRCNTYDITAMPKSIEDRVGVALPNDLRVGAANDGIKKIIASNPGDYVLTAICDQQTQEYDLRVTLPTMTFTNEPLRQPVAWLRADTPYPVVMDTRVVGEERFVDFWGNELNMDTPVGWSKFPTDSIGDVRVIEAARHFSGRRALEFSGDAGLQWFTPPELEVGSIMFVLNLDNEAMFERQFLLGGPTLDDERLTLRAKNTLELCWTDTFPCIDEGLSFQAIDPLSSTLVHTLTFDGTQVQHFVAGTNFPSCTNEAKSGRDAFTLARLGYLDDENTMRGQIAEMLVFDAALSKDDRRPFETYLRKKYGVMTNNTMSPAPCFQ